MGDQAALSASPAAQLRWCSSRLQIVKEIQARADAERQNLQLENKGLMERVEKLEKERQDPERELGQKNLELLQARGQNEKLRNKVQEMTDGYNQSLDEITKKKDAAVAQAEGLLRVVRYAARELKEFPANKRIEYAAQLMSFSLKQAEVAERLGKLMENPSAHEEYYANKAVSDPTPSGCRSQLASAASIARQRGDFQSNGSGCREIAGRTFRHHSHGSNEASIRTTLRH